MAATHYPDVPDHFKWPWGNYKQAPGGVYGSDWWQVTWANQEPWKEAVTPDAGGAPEEFTSVFGPRPSRGHEFYGEWNSNLRQFQGKGLPDNISQSEVDFVIPTYEAWGMGAPAIYLGVTQYGYRARFPETGNYWYERGADIVVDNPQLVIADYQAKCAKRGIVPTRWHPWVPPHVQKAAEAEAKKLASGSGN